MAKVKKRTGREEDFDRSKLEKSLKRTGAKDETVREIAEKIKPREGITTSEVRSQAASELRSRNVEAAKHYESTRTRKAKTSSEVPIGTVRLDEKTLKALNASAGDTMELVHEGKTQRMKVEAFFAAQEEIQLHPEALEALGATEGTKVAFRRAAS
ncbi:hypothetical protein KAX17_05060 [Candidatus Bipolaricaulota bacterium]|nr:hypothetical protein [Candidatus Bipolaricaulota bacterium]